VVGEVTGIRVVLLSETNSKFGAPVLRRLMEYPGVEVVGVLTRAPGVLCDYYLDDPDPVDIAELAEAAGLPVLRPVRVNDPDVVDRLRSLAPDFLFIANYRQILRAPILSVPAVGTVNLHPGPLPRYAGLAPFFWMAKNGEREGGTSMVWTTTEIDGGPLIAQRKVVLNGTETAARIMDLHFQASWQLMDDVLPSMVVGSFQVIPQDDGERTYFGQPQAADTTIDWTESTETILRTVRASSAMAGAAAVTASGSTFQVLKAEALEEQTTAGMTGKPAKPGELRLFDHGRPAVRSGDGWVKLVSISLTDDTPHDERLTVRNLPALLGALDLGA
jgi:methionyl-tRNA formyltransferase